MAHQHLRTWLPVTVAFATVLPLTLACSQAQDNPSGTSAPSEAAQLPDGGGTSSTATPANPDQADTAVTIEADAGGRTLAGSCSGPTDSGRPPVVLVTGLGNDRSQLEQIRTALSVDTRVCDYDRAGRGASSAAPSPQTLTEAASDLASFLAEVGSDEPYVLVGHSVGGSITLLFALDHPEQVAGLVAMNPVPPYSFTDVAPFQDAAEQEGEKEFFGGGNEEQLDMRDTERLLIEDIPDDLPYVVMLSPEDCPPHLCQALADATQSLADAGATGQLISVEGAGHEIWRTDLDLVIQEIEGLLRG